VLDCAKVLGRVFVLGTIATSDMAAGQTKPQMDPPIAHLQAFLAAFGLRFHITNLIDMSAEETPNG
jgi:hypothetical protein